ncbi:CGP-CTERM sorting domain-containing protein [Thermococcus indicus]|uniref:CGP-CTERM sorting domain-containing protein n=1 Tax=Thermococcus indicus TaxID=2586643 RepID=A0A4Y5SJ64_9EURY|nr:CGP-CTERM sorting domain-containing protein [Thermococcus indicus]QDA30464.1 CGP-CTERM sorting domain-containing protein [Thermococcus indicus]
MSRLMSYLSFLVLALLLFFPLTSAQEVYEVKYAVMSNGSDALIPLQVLTYEPYCPPLSGINCANATTGEVLGGEEHLFYFNGSQLYLLNFTPAFRALYPNYSTLLDQSRALYHYTLGQSLNGARFINGSWYLDLTFYPPMTHVHGIYLFNPKNLCIEPVNVSWLKLPKGKISDEINGWRIELQSPSFKKWDYANVSDVWVTMSENALRWSPGPTEVVNSSVFPIYFLLKKEGHVKNITLVYLNMNVTRDDFVPPNTPVPGYWFPDSVKIANVTVCEKASANTGKTGENVTANSTDTPHTPPIKTTPSHPTSTKENSKICGPGLVTLLAVIPVLMGRLKRRVE